MANETDNIIVLRSVFGKVGQKYFLNPVRDPQTGRYPDCVRPVDSKGDMLLRGEGDKGKCLIAENRVFIIEDGKTFDLTDPWQAAEWYSIQHCPMIAMSRDQRDKNGNLVIDGDSKRYGGAELYVERPGYETNKRVNKRRLIHDAEEYIIKDPQGAAGRLKMAKLLGRNMRNAPDADVEDFLMNIASKDPEKIINLYTGDDIALRLLFIDAKDKRVIYVKNKVYLYSENQIPLGASDDAVITWMKSPQNRRTLELIKRDTYPELYEQPEPDFTNKIKDEETKMSSSTGKYIK